MTTPTSAISFADPAPADRLERAASALTAHGFTAEILDDAAAARIRIKDLIWLWTVSAEAAEMRRLLASPDVIVGSVAALTETGSLVVASGSGSQLPGYAGGAARAIWIVGAQKVVPDLSTALRRVEEHALPLESARTQEVYGWPSAVNRLLILNAEFHPGRGTVLLLREAIGF